MPAISSGWVLLTGANGYIATWIFKKLLEQGFSVRGTVRSSEKGIHLQEAFKSYGSKVEVVVIPDITKEGAFDKAVNGVDAVVHTASPCHTNASDPSEIITPAVAGTTGIITSVSIHGHNVRRVVVLSSIAAVWEPHSSPRTYSEDNWNQTSIDEVEKKGKDADGVMKYMASKTLAEKAAWDFFERHKVSLNWDLVVLNPSFVFGPAIHSVDSMSSLNSSASVWFTSVLEGTTNSTTTFSDCWIDVRDIAQAHVLALTKQDAGDNRILVTSTPSVWQDWINIARKLYPNAGIPAGDHSHDPAHFIYPIRYDTSKASRLLGMTYRTQEEVTRDFIEFFKEKGWWGENGSTE